MQVIRPQTTTEVCLVTVSRSQVTLTVSVSGLRFMQQDLGQTKVKMQRLDSVL